LTRDLRERWRAYANDQIAAQLTARKWTIATAESCTGGLIGDVLTNRAGSSAYFMGGVLSYSNDIKHRVLGVREETLSAGAVSEPCALEMARGVRRALGVDVGISATGIAGPDGGTTDKPVGLVYVGLSTPDTEIVSRNVWPHDRIGNKQATADEALRLLMTHLT
jgi:PncC family amidohydrolase